MSRQTAALWMLFAWASPAWADDVRAPPLDQLEVVPAQADVNSWVRMTNGEWLWGEVKSIRNDEITIDSDQFGVEVIGLGDVSAVWNARSFEWARNNDEIYTGPGVIVGDTVRVLDSTRGEVVFPLRELDGIAQGSGREKDRWSGYIHLGFDGRWGNAPQLGLNGGFGFKREDAVTRFTFDESSSFGRAQGEDTANNHRAEVEMDVFLSQAFYLVVPGASVYFDRFQNVAPRGSVNLGAGLRHEASSSYEIGFSLSAVGQITRYYSVEAGQDPSDLGIGALVGAYQEWDVTGDIDFDWSWASTIIFNDIGQTSHHGQISWRQDIIADFEFEVSAVYDRVENPPPLEDGTEVKSDDFGIVVGLRLDL